MRITVVHGLSGEGKSQLALEFAHRCRADFDCIYWMVADTPIKLATGYAEIATRNHIEETGRTQTQDRIKEWLCDTGMPEHKDSISNI